jgi:hypothetical protein
MEARPSRPDAHNHSIDVRRPTHYCNFAANAGHAGYSLDLDEPVCNFGDLFGEDA